MEKTMSTTRNIVVKTLLNADEFLEFERKCKESDLSHSRAIREMLKNWLHRSATGLRRERTGTGQKLALFPGRRISAPVPLRL